MSQPDRSVATWLRAAVAGVATVLTSTGAITASIDPPDCGLGGGEAVIVLPGSQFGSDPSGAVRIDGDVFQIWRAPTTSGTRYSIVRFGPGPSQEVVWSSGGASARAFGDADGDGTVDALLVAVDSGVVSFGLVRDVAGEAIETALFPVADANTSVGFPVALDADGDGADEFIVAIDGTQKGLLEWPNGDGGPTLGSAIAALENLSTSNRELFIADADGDGDDDLLRRFGIAGEIARIESTEAGLVELPRRLTTDARPIIWSDLDGDARPDLVTLGEDAEDITFVDLHLGSTEFAFAPPRRSTLGRGIFALDDFASLRDIPLAVTPLGSPEAPLEDVEIRPLAIDDDGYLAFTERIMPARLGAEAPEFLLGLATDLDGDGSIDTVTDLGGQSPRLLIRRGGSAATLATSTSIPMVFGPTKVVALDVDGDDDLDLVGVETGFWTTRIRGAGGFTPLPEDPLGSGGPGAVGTLDWDGDGRRDVLRIGATGVGIIFDRLLEDGIRTRLDGGSGGGGYWDLTGASFGHVDGGERLDAVITREEDEDGIRIAFGRASGFDSRSASVHTPGPPYRDPALVDVDGDGIADFVVAVRRDLPATLDIATVDPDGSIGPPVGLALGGAEAGSPTPVRTGGPGEDLVIPLDGRLVLIRDVGAASPTVETLVEGASAGRVQTMDLDGDGIDELIAPDATDGVVVVRISAESVIEPIGASLDPATDLFSVQRDPESAEPVVIVVRAADTVHEIHRHDGRAWRRTARFRQRPTQNTVHAPWLLDSDATPQPRLIAGGDILRRTADGLWGADQYGPHDQSGFPHQLIPSDVDADGDTDVLLIGGSFNTTPIRVTSLINDGFGGFDSGPTIAPGSTIAVGDLDGDGYADLVHAEGSTLVMRRGDPRAVGGFGEARILPASSGFARPIISPAIDGRRGVLHVQDADRLSSRVGARGVPTEAIPVPLNWDEVEFGDLDGDGADDDILFFDVSAGTGRAFRFVAGDPSTLHAHGGALDTGITNERSTAALLDADGDGRDDAVFLVAPNDDTELVIFRNNGTSFDAPVRRPFRRSGLVRVRLTASDVDGDGAEEILRPAAIPDAVEIIRPVPCPECAADLDGDGTVGLGDLLAVLASWGDCATGDTRCVGDLDGDARVALPDLLIVLTDWGTCR